MKKIFPILFFAAGAFTSTAQDDCYRIKGTDSLQLSANGYPTTLCMGTPVNVGMATIASYYHEIKKGDVPVKSGEGNGGALSFETTALSSEAGGMFQALSTKYGCPPILTNKVVLTYNGIRIQNLSGGGIYCASNPGLVLHLDSSEAGVSYQLYLRGTNDPDQAIGGAVAGTGAPLNFPVVTVGGNYYVRATSPTCILDMGDVLVSSSVNGLQFSQITSTSVKLTWRNLNAYRYEYAVTTDDLPPVAGAPTTDTSVVVNFLTPSTAYYVYVRPLCSSGVFGEWTTTTFNTIAAPPDCNAKALTLCINDTIVLPAGNGSWNFYGNWPDNSNGYSTEGREFVVSFTPSTTGFYQLNVASNTYAIDFLMKLASAGCTSTGWKGIGRVYNGKIDLGQLIGGTKYYIVADQGFTSDTSRIAVSVCSYAAPCAVTSNIAVCTPVTASIASGTGAWNFNGYAPDNSTGYSTPGKEVLYTFTPSGSGVHYLDVTAANGFSASYLYKLVSGGCSNTGWTGIAAVNTTGQYFIGNLTAGQQYYIIIDAHPVNATVTQTFRICQATAPVCPGTTLSLCTTASTTIPAGIGGWSFNYANHTQGKESLFLFTPAVTGNYGLEVTSASFSDINYLYKAASGGCNGNGWTNIAYMYGPGTVNIGTLVGGIQYYILLDRRTTIGSLSSTFRICKIDPPDCAAAPSITVCNTVAATILSGGGAWDSVSTTVGVRYHYGKELMYKFTPASRGLYYLNVTSVSNFNPVGYYIKPASSGCTISGWKLITSTYNKATNLIDTLEAGVQYYFLLDAEYANGSIHNFQICMVPSQNCASPITFGSCQLVSETLNQGIGGWNISDTLAGGTITNYGPGPEKLFSFTCPQTGQYNFNLVSLSGDNYPGVKFNIKNAATGCTNSGWKSLGTYYQTGSKLLGELQSGVTYYIMADNASTTYNCNFAFSICSTEVSDCANALPVPPCLIVNAAMPAGTGNWNFSGRFPSNSVGWPTPGREIFYKFTPSVTGLYYIYAVPPQGSESISFLMRKSNTGCSNTGWTGIARFNNTSAPQMRIGELQGGQEYIIMLDNETTDGASIAFKICKSDFPDCNAATVLALCNNVTAAIPEGYGAVDQLTIGQGIKGYFTPGKELIYTYTPSFTGQCYIEVISTSNAYADYFIKTASAGCDTSGWRRLGEFNAAGVANIGTLTAGVKYYIMLDNETTGSITHVFKLCRSDAQNCSTGVQLSPCGVTTVNFGSGGIGAWNFAGTYPVNSTGYPTPGRELVYRFTPTVSGIHYLEVSSGSGLASFLYKPAASGCNDTGWTGIWRFYTFRPKHFGPLQAGVPYYILLDNESYTSASSYSFKVCAAPPPTCNPAPEIFEETQVVTSINSGPGSWDFENQIFYNQSKASTPGQEIFFRFKPSRSGPYFLKLTSGNDVAFLYKKISDPCTANTWTAIGLFSPNNERQVGILTAGTEYIIMADNYGTANNAIQFIITSGLNICPGENITFSMRELNSGGSDTYQWQVDKGMGYVNISDNQYYSGSTYHTLNITNPPGSFYNYKYRGVAKAVGGFGSFTETTDFKPLKMTNSWLGTSANWHDPSNWSCNLVPDMNTDVQIPAGTPNTPIVSSSTTIRSLNIKQGGAVRVNSGSVLTIKGK